MKWPCKKGTFFRAFRSMKSLILIRHASALPEQYPQRDFDRELSDDGRREADSLGRYLMAKTEIPELVLSSPAKRTLATSEIICRHLGENHHPPRSSMPLYNAGYSVILEQIHNFSPAANSAMLVGHNPGISQVATILSGLHPYQFSTASALYLEFHVESWLQVQQGTGKEIWYYCP